MAGGETYPCDVQGFLVNDIDHTTKTPGASVRIVRDAGHTSNLSGGKEVFVPSRLLYGVLPQALLDAYRFWQDESVAPKGVTDDEFLASCRGYKRLRGYPVDEEGEFILFVEFTYVGSEKDFGVSSSTTDSNCVVQATGFPGRTVQVTRRVKSTVVEEFEGRKLIAARLEKFCLLRNHSHDTKREKKVVENATPVFKMDAEVECDHEGKNCYWPCTVVKVNENGTYDIEFIGDYSWVGIQREVFPELLQTRGKEAEDAKKTDMGLYEGMSDDENEIWRDDSDNEGDTSDDNLPNSSQLTFLHFDQLDKIIISAKCDINICCDTIGKISENAATFYDVQALADAVAAMLGNKPDECTQIATLHKWYTNSDDLVLLDMLYSSIRSRLHSVMKTLARIENVGHICGWTKASNVPTVINRFQCTRRG